VIPKDHQFDPECEGCQPVILDPETGTRLPPDHPFSMTALKVWKALPRWQQEALNRVWVHDSQLQEDLAVMQIFVLQIEEEMA
jgi:hypothetical protein